MLYVYVFNGQICGSTTSPDSGIPDGWECIPAPEGVTSLDQVYYSNGEILRKPPRPNDGNFYRWKNNQWVED